MYLMRILLALSMVAVLTVSVYAIGRTNPGPTSAGSGPPGMVMDAPATAFIGSPFTITVRAEPAPSVPVSGFAAEIALPPTLKRQARPACADEVVATSGGNALPICLREVGVPDGEIRLVAGSGSALPLPALDTPLLDLVEIDVACNAPGGQTVVLTAHPTSPFGAVYFELDASSIGVQTKDYGGTPVADFLVVDCAVAPTATSTPTSTPTATSTATATPTPTKQPPPGDTDGDGCTDQRENGPDPAQGGQRDYLNFWDFFDVPTGAGLTRDRNVASLDIFQVLGRFNGTDIGSGDFDRNSDPLSMPNSIIPGADRANYHPAYDRGPLVGPSLWNLGPADGSIAAADIFAVLAQFGHTCA